MIQEKFEQLLAHVEDGYAPNTIRAYRADFSEFILFAELALAIGILRVRCVGFSERLPWRRILAIDLDRADEHKTPQAGCSRLLG